MKENPNCLGKLRIDYEQDGNRVQGWNRPHMCSLVVNGRLVDHYDKVVASPFVLHGVINPEGERIHVMATMGGLFMKLYYDNKCVKKIFMGFG